MLNEIVALIILVALLISVAMDVVHRTTMAIAIALVSVVVGSILGFYAPWQALRAVNFVTLIFLVGMGIFTAVMQRTGVFEWLTMTLVLKSKMQPAVLVPRLLILSYLISCFVINVSVVFIMVPIMLSICRQFDLNPVPLCVAQVAAINLGGASTMVGDFPNIIIATSTPTLTFMDFQTNLFPICFALLVAMIFMFRKMYPEYFTRFEPGPAARAFAADLAERRASAIKDKPLLVWSVAVLVGMLALLVAAVPLHIPLALIPTGGAVIILIGYETRLIARHDKEVGEDRLVRRNIIGDDIAKLLGEVHWDTVLFLMSLFVVVGMLEQTQVLTWVAQFIVHTSGGNPLIASILIVGIGSVISLSSEAGPATTVGTAVVAGISGIGQGGLLYWALSLGVQAGSSTTMIGANEGPLAARMLEADARAHDAPYRLTPKGFTHIGVRMWLLFIPLSIAGLAGIIVLGPVAMLAAFVFAAVTAAGISVFGLGAKVRDSATAKAPAPLLPPSRRRPRPRRAR